MNEGVKVLIERMKTNPDDFQMHPIRQGVRRGRFYWITEEMQNYLTRQGNHYYMTLLKQEDVDALVDAFKDMHQQEFTDKVMKDLFKEEEQIPTPNVAGGWMPNGRTGTTISPQGKLLQGWTDPRLIHQGNATIVNPYQAQIDSTSGLTSVSNGGTGTTASPWFKGLFK
jgi:hypothetical protein